MSELSLVNLALQSFGSRTTITQAQLVAGSNNEAKQANLAFANVRDGLFRLAPWNCSLKIANLVYITSTSGTPENTSAPTPLWQPGQPRPPWTYEYQYPAGCLRACWIVPSSQSSYAGGVPITTAVTGGAVSTWLGVPIPFRVATDQFLMVTTPIVIAGGAGYAIDDIITPGIVNASVLTTSRLGSFNPSAPQGAPAQFRVASVNGSGGVISVQTVNQIIDADPPRGGSYFYGYETTPSTTTNGNGAGCILTYDLKPVGITPGSPSWDQRVILTNQQSASLVFCHRVSDTDVWDPLFQDAFYNALGASMCLALTGDKGLANRCIVRANDSIIKARQADGNESLTINDITPDWICGRGISWADGLITGPSFDWGGLLPTYT